MGLRINQNIAAMNAYRNLSVNDNQMSKSLEKLSSGFRINRAADDAAGLAISEGLRSQVGGLKVAARNAQDGISVVQTAEGALTETHAIVQRMRDLAVQAGNAGASDANSLGDLQAEVTALNSELDRLAGKTTFNNINLLDGSYKGKDFQVGYASGDTIAVTINSGTADAGFDSTDLGTATIDLAAAGGATAAITALDTAIQKVSTARANLGALQNRFEHVVNSVNVAVENLSASESRIRDTDMAQEMVSFTRSQILSQAGTAMLAQANQAPQSVMQLLRG
ncbi:flagellin [Spirillospora sp. CA-253888]